MEGLYGFYNYLLLILPLILGFLYGYVSSKGQFCMNSGFSNVIRRRDTTKLKSFIAAILIQMLVLPLTFVVIYLNSAESSIINHLSLPPLYLIGSALGGFLFGIFMYYTAGCGAGIFYKIGEKNTGAFLATIGFFFGIFITEYWLLSSFKESTHSIVLLDQKPLWKSDNSLLIGIWITIIASILLFVLYKSEDKTPNGAAWGWQKTGGFIGVIGILSWASALLSKMPFGMSIIPGVLDMIDLRYSWVLWFVLGIPLGAFWSTRKDEHRKFSIPLPTIIGRRLLGGIGLGISGSIAAGCTVGHGLTFFPLLGIGSIVATVFIFLGSGLVGHLTRR